MSTSADSQQHESPLESQNAESAKPLKPLNLRQDGRMKNVECNCMSYTDDKEVTREIWMPRGTAGYAGQRLQAEDWEELAKFPTWNGQKYAEDDYFYIDEFTGEKKRVVSGKEYLPRTLEEALQDIEKDKSAQTDA